MLGHPMQKHKALSGVAAQIPGAMLCCAIEERFCATILMPRRVLQVILKPYLVWNDRYNNPATLGALGPDQPPTASPPVLSLEGGLEFRVYNNATSSSVRPPSQYTPRTLEKPSSSDMLLQSALCSV